jgi:hypothetical protein
LTSASGSRIATVPFASAIAVSSLGTACCR